MPRRGNAADLLDLGAGDRLVIGDDGERLERRARQLALLDRLAGEQIGRGLRPCGTPICRRADKIDAARGIFGLQAPRARAATSSPGDVLASFGRSSGSAAANSSASPMRQASAKARTEAASCATSRATASSTPVIALRVVFRRDPQLLHIVRHYARFNLRLPPCPSPIAGRKPSPAGYRAGPREPFRASQKKPTPARSPRMDGSTRTRRDNHRGGPVAQPAEQSLQLLPRLHKRPEMPPLHAHARICMLLPLPGIRLSRS